MKRAQFGIKTIFSLTVVLAIALVLMRPFSPQILFEPIASDAYDAESKIICKYQMVLTNNGVLPIWLAASSDEDPVYVHASGYRHQGHLSALRLDDLISAANKEVHWIRLGSGESLSVDLGAAMKRPHLLGLNIRDWRGREAEAWSQSYIPPHF